MSRKKPKTVSVGFIALGCPKNVVDSERMLAQIAQAGMPICTEPEKAEVIVVNTCGFIEPAKAEALEAIKQAVQCKRNGRVKKVIVAGCLPERLGWQLFDQAEGTDAIVGLGRRDAITSIIEKTLASQTPAAYLDHTGPKIADDRVRFPLTPGHYMYLRISEGCNHHCSFCTIPAIRGRFRSKPPKLVLDEAAELVSAGAVELDLIGQDTTCYGRDLKIKNALPSLLSKLQMLAGLVWIRLMYAYPAGIDDRLLEVIANSDKVVHYIDMPIQHINNEILRRMRRPDTKARLCDIIETLRSAVPDIVLRTTVIVGFPGESDRQFEELIEFIKWAEFDALGCFQFYPESGTAAADMPAQVPEKVKRQRIEHLMLTQQKITFARNKKRIAGSLTCLLDSVGPDGTGKGRFYGQAPDIDSICILKNCSAKTGQFVNAKVVDTKDYDLIVEQH